MSSGVLAGRLSWALTRGQELQAGRCHWSLEGRGVCRSRFSSFKSSASMCCVCVWLKKLIPASLPGWIIKAKENHVFPTKRSTRWPFRNPANWESTSLGMAIASSPTLHPPSPRSLRESWMVAVAFSPCAWRLMVGGGVELVRGEEEPGHARSRRDFFGTDVMMFIPPSDLGRGSLRRALGLDSIWKSRVCGMPTLALDHLCWHSWGMAACMGSLSQPPGPLCWGPSDISYEQRAPVPAISGVDSTPFREPHC